ncbi:hypothetical protein M3231_15880 [Neobacillus mesonae]|nr:hypothetical protein [Neobacillus mesonae]
MSQRNGHHMKHHMKKCFPPLKPIVCEPVNVVKNHFHPQIQPVIHPVQIINKHHPVPVPVHEWVVSETEEVVGGANTGMYGMNGMNGMNGVAGASTMNGVGGMNTMNGVGGMYGKDCNRNRRRR